MQQVISWVLARLGEPSTWAGIGIAATTVAHALQSNASLGVAVAAAVAAVIMNEKKA